MLLKSFLLTSSLVCFPLICKGRFLVYLVNDFITPSCARTIPQKSLKVHSAQLYCSYLDRNLFGYLVEDNIVFHWDGLHVRKASFQCNLQA
jgi:hypothetical protein